MLLRFLLIMSIIRIYIECPYFVKVYLLLHCTCLLVSLSAKENFIVILHCSMTQAYEKNID